MALKNILLLVLSAYTNYCCAQVIDNTSTFHNSGNKYIRLHYDNDYFTKSDEFYTQGITLEYVSPFLKKNPLTKILFRPSSSEIKYGISFDHYVYTPTSIRHDEILFGDRPFCANISLKTFVIATNPLLRQRIASAIVIGLIGQGAGGKEMQATIHGWLGGVKPHGWHNQVSNDLILDYQLNYEKNIVSGEHTAINIAGEGRIGSHNDNLKGGFNFMLGNFNDPFKTNNDIKKDKKKISYYLYGQVQGGLIGYDATLQGGLFNNKSPYTIPTGDISRTTFQCDYGIVVSFAKMYMEYTQSYLTREFSTQSFHRWGGVRLGVNF